MGVEGALKFAFHVAKKNPRLLTPAVIMWIPYTLGIVVTAFVLSEFSLLSLMSLENVMTVSTLVQWGLFLSFYVTVWWLSTIMIKLIYTEITRQFATRKKPDIAKAFYVAKKNLLPQIWIDVITSFIVTAAFIAPTIAFGAIGIVINSGAVVIVGAVIGGAIAMYASLKFALVSPVLIFEDARGLNAVKRSFTLTKGLSWRLLVAIGTVGFVTSVIISALAWIPLIGFTLALFSSLFLIFWISTIPAAFYFEYNLKRK